jgi:nucleotide-binding universal stress UspA family protein
MSDTEGREGGRVVVGVDGSSGSVHALAWAGREFRVRNATLEVVAAWMYPTLVLLVPVAPDPPQVKTLRKHAREMIEHALEKVADDVAGLNVDLRVVEGDTSAVLLERAKGAISWWSAVAVSVAFAACSWGL